MVKFGFYSRGSRQYSFNIYTGKSEYLNFCAFDSRFLLIPVSNVYFTGAAPNSNRQAGPMGRSTRRARSSISGVALFILNRYYHSYAHYANGDHLHLLSVLTGLTTRTIRGWFERQRFTENRGPGTGQDAQDAQDAEGQEAQDADA